MTKATSELTIANCAGTSARHTWRKGLTPERLPGSGGAVRGRDQTCVLGRGVRRGGGAHLSGEGRYGCGPHRSGGRREPCTPGTKPEVRPLSGRRSSVCPERFRGQRIGTRQLGPQLGPISSGRLSGVSAHRLQHEQTQGNQLYFYYRAGKSLQHSRR
jgi:hypothetical protein